MQGAEHFFIKERGLHPRPTFFALSKERVGRRKETLETGKRLERTRPFPVDPKKPNVPNFYIDRRGEIHEYPKKKKK